MTSWIRVENNIVVAIDTVAPFPESIEVEDVPEVPIGSYLEYGDGVFTIKEYPKAEPPPDAKALKIAELNKACNTTILAGFISEALGSPHFYDFGTDDQINLSGALDAIREGILTDENLVWKASGNPTPHTVSQFKQVFADGFAFKNFNIGRYWTLKSRVLSGEPLEDIQW